MNMIDTLFLLGAKKDTQFCPSRPNISLFQSLKIREKLFSFFANLPSMRLQTFGWDLDEDLFLRTKSGLTDSF